MKHNINIFQDDYKKLASSQTSFWVTSRGCVSLFSEEDTKWLISNYPKPLLLQMEKKKKYFSRTTVFFNFKRKCFSALNQKTTS